MQGRPLAARPFVLRALELDPLSVDVQHLAGLVGAPRVGEHRGLLGMDRVQAMALLYNETL